MKKLLLTGAALALTTTGALAADIIEPTAYDWTGPYIGLQGGYAWGENDVDLNPVLGGAPSAFADLVDDVDPLSANGFIGGAHIGYLLQSDSFVYGVEGDIELADLSDDANHTAGDDSIGTINKDIDWLGSLRLRAGLAFDRTLLYATGGLAFGEASLDIDLSDLAEGDGITRDPDDGTQWGWTIGAGLEYAFTDELSARIEYRYTDLGSTKARITVDVDSSYDLEAENDFHTVRAGLSWHF